MLATPLVAVLLNVIHGVYRPPIINLLALTSRSTQPYAVTVNLFFPSGIFILSIEKTNPPFSTDTTFSNEMSILTSSFGVAVPYMVTTSPLAGCSGLMLKSKTLALTVVAPSIRKIKIIGKICFIIFSSTALQLPELQLLSQLRIPESATMVSVQELLVGL